MCFGVCDELGGRLARRVHLQTYRDVFTALQTSNAVTLIASVVSVSVLVVVKEHVNNNPRFKPYLKVPIPVELCLVRFLPCAVSLNGGCAVPRCGDDRFRLRLWGIVGGYLLSFRGTELLIGFQDVAFLSSRARFNTTFLRNCGRGECPKLAACPQTTVWGKQWHALCGIFLVQQILFPVSVEFHGDRKTVVLLS